MGKKSWLASLFTVPRPGEDRPLYWGWQAGSTSLAALKTRREQLLLDKDLGTRSDLQAEWAALITTLDERTRALLNRAGVEPIKVTSNRRPARVRRSEPSGYYGSRNSSAPSTDEKKARSFLSEYVDAEQPQETHHDPLTEGLLPGVIPHIEIFRQSDYPSQQLKDTTRPRPASAGADFAAMGYGIGRSSGGAAQLDKMGGGGDYAAASSSSGAMLRQGSEHGPLPNGALPNGAPAAAVAAHRKHTGRGGRSTASPASLTVSVPDRYGNSMGAHSVMQLSSESAPPSGLAREDAARSDIEKARSFLYEFMDAGGAGEGEEKQAGRDSVSPVLMARSLALTPDQTGSPPSSYSSHHPHGRHQSSSNRNRSSSYSGGGGGGSSGSSGARASERRMAPESPSRSPIKTLRQLRSGVGSRSYGGSRGKATGSAVAGGRESGGGAIANDSGGSGGSGISSQMSWAKVDTAPASIDGDGRVGGAARDGKLPRTVSQEEAYAAHQLLVAQMWKELAAARKRKARLLASAAERRRPPSAPSPNGGEYSESSEAEELAGLHKLNSAEFKAIKAHILHVSSEIDELVMDLEKMGYLPIMDAPKAEKQRTKPAARAPIPWNNPDKRILGRRPKPPGTTQRGTQLW